MKIEFNNMKISGDDTVLCSPEGVKLIRYLKDGRVDTVKPLCFWCSLGAFIIFIIIAVVTLTSSPWINVIFDILSLVSLVLSVMFAYMLWGKIVGCIALIGLLTIVVCFLPISKLLPSLKVVLNVVYPFIK